MKRAILLADDSSTIHRLVERTFDGSEFSVVCVSNGEAAIRKLDEVQPAAVLADIYMPGKNGYEVCEFVRKHDGGSTTPVVLLVGAFEVFDEAEAERVGADGKITKPFEPKQLAELISGLVRGNGGKTGTVDPVPLTSLPEVAPVSRAEIEPSEGSPAPIVKGAVSEVGDGESEVSADGDILGLRELFPETTPERRHALSEQEVDAIADRVIERLSSEVVESIAWDIVPEIADRVMRDELKRKE